jgi:branched-chain amino acid transport system ATP-binding protein
LATGPRLLLLDEVMSGLTQAEAQRAIALLRELREDVTIIMIEHVMEILMPISDRVVVLVEGEKLVEGPPAEISTDRRVIIAYLGEKFLANGQ